MNLSRFALKSFAASRGERRKKASQSARSCLLRLRACVTFVQRIIGVRLQEEILNPDHDSVEIENGLPVFSQDIQAHISRKIQVGMVNLHNLGQRESGRCAGDTGNVVMGEYR